MERHETYGILILIILALAMLGWLLHQVLDGDVIREVAGYLVKLTNGLFPVIAHDMQRSSGFERHNRDRNVPPWPENVRLPQRKAEATFPS